MPLASSIDSIVARLETSLMPHLSEFARAIMASDEGITAETSSNRYAPAVHVFGISCRPAGTSILDYTTVALVVNVIGITELSYNATIVWQTAPREWAKRRLEAQTSNYHKNSSRALAKFEREALALLPVLTNAARRGRQCNRSPDGG